MLEGIADLLEVADIGYRITVLTASDGRIGLASLNEIRPDLIISDIMMPNMGGFELLERVRSNPDWIHIPVVFLTAKGTREDILKGRLSGAELYITKPYDSVEFLDLVRSQLDRAFELERDRTRRYETFSRNIIQLLNHEFRTPLTYVTAYSELLNAGLLRDDAADIREYLRGIRIGAQRLSKLVEDLVVVMELRAGRVKERFERHAEVITDFEALLEWGSRRNYEGKIDLDSVFFPPNLDNVTPVIGVRSDLTNALDRLLENALKYAIIGKGRLAEVHVSLKADENEIRIDISDNGIGFPMRVGPRLFELFYQYNRDEIEQQGAGTGLTIAREIVELHGGRIEFESTEGQGSTFSVVLPRYETNRLAPNSRNYDGSLRKKATVLVVEDEALLLQGICDLMEVFEGKYEFIVETASDGFEGLEVLSKIQPNLIITDIMMPRMDGYELIRKVREVPEWVNIPVIFLTAKGERQDIVRGRRVGAEEYITKPYDANEFFGLLTTQLDRHFQKQSVMSRTFEELKQSVLNLLRSDFQLPLVAVADYSEKMIDLLEEVHSESELITHLQGIRSSSQEVNRLVEDFIFLAEVQTGEASLWFEMKSQPCSLAAFLDNLGIDGNAKVDWSRVILTASDRTKDAIVLADPTRLRFGIGRVVEAVQKRQKEPSRGLCQIMVSISEHARLARLEISLESSRFSDHDIRQLRWHLATSRPIEPELSGIAPGLLMAKAVINLHGGKIAIEKELNNTPSIVISLPVKTYI